jgi:hypothetical protein
VRFNEHAETVGRFYLAAWSDDTAWFDDANTNVVWLSGDLSGKAMVPGPTIGAARADPPGFCREFAGVLTPA